MTSNKLSEVSELITEKNEALTKAIEYINTFIEKCPGNGCDLASDYHWRGCRKKITPFIQELMNALKAR